MCKFNVSNMINSFVECEESIKKQCGEAVYEALKMYGKQEVRQTDDEDEEAGAEMVVRSEGMPKYVYIDEICVDRKTKSVLVSVTEDDDGYEPDWMFLNELEGIKLSDIAPFIRWKVE